MAKKDGEKVGSLTPYEQMVMRRLDERFSLKEGTCKYGCKRGCGECRFVQTSSGSGVWKMFRTSECVED